MREQIDLSGLDPACKDVCLRLANEYGLEPASNYRRLILGLDPINSIPGKRQTNPKGGGLEKDEKTAAKWKEKIILAIGDDEVKIEDIITKIEENPNTIRNWVARLEKAGLIIGRTKAKGKRTRRYYRVNNSK
jgi:predicted Rossmann fold nucleotide-binding protein DprA/Smf involved in DNA uptake